MSGRKLHVVDETGDWLPPLEKRIRELREHVSLLRDQNGRLEYVVAEQTKALAVREAEARDRDAAYSRLAEELRIVRHRAMVYAQRLAQNGLLEEGEENPYLTKPRFNWIAAIVFLLAAGCVGQAFWIQRLLQGGG